MSGVNSNTSAQFTGLPSPQALISNPNGGVTSVWFRFFQGLWLQVSSGTPLSLTLAGAHSAAGNASDAAAGAAADVVTERDRALAAEAALQTQITNNLTNLQGQINTINGTLGSLQSQITTINNRLAAAGIP